MSEGFLAFVGGALFSASLSLCMRWLWPAKEPIQRGWLIERQGPEYLTVNDWSGFGWTQLAWKAIRFVRREDAEQVIRLVESEDCKATEHQWG